MPGGSTNRATLDEIALAHGTDKSTASHGYTLIYEQYMERLREQPITLLELGYGGHEDPAAGGASARMWRDYLPNATIVVIDNEHKTNIPDRVHYRQGSQADPAFIDALAAEFGPFDIIVDDASHLSSLTIASFKLLYPHLRGGGMYVLEDSHGAYHAFYYGAHEANPDPDGRTTNGAPTMMQFFRRLADEVNFHGGGDRDLFPRRYWLGYCLDSVHFYFDLVIVKKSADA